MANHYKPLAISVADTGAASRASCPICTCPVGRFRRAIPIPLLACKSCGTPLMSKLPIWANVGFVAMMLLWVLYGYLWISADPSRMNNYIWHYAFISPAVIVATMLPFFFFLGRPHPANSWRYLTTEEVVVLRTQYTGRTGSG